MLRTKESWFESSGSSTLVHGTAVTGDTVNLLAGRDITVTGSGLNEMTDAAGNVLVANSGLISENATNLVAGRDINILSAYQSTEGENTEWKTRSGLSYSNLSISDATTKSSAEHSSQSTMAAGSTIGSMAGSITISAGADYRQIGSDISSAAADVNITAAGNVYIEEAREIERELFAQRFKQSGVTIGLSHPLLDLAQGASSIFSLAEVATRSDNARTQALAGAATALALYNNRGLIDKAQNLLSGNGIDALMQDPTQGIGINISLGVSKSQSSGQSLSETARGSNLGAGGSVNIQAHTGDIKLQGSTINAGQDVNLNASEGNIELLASKNHYEYSSSNSSSSGSVGVSFTVGGQQNGIRFNLGLAMAKGNEDGTATIYDNSTITAAGTTRLTSGQNTTLQGAVINSDKVIADIGGDLLITSLQDTDQYNSAQKNAGLSLSLCIPPLCYGTVVSGMVNFGKTDINSNYQSVGTQSGIHAGDGGFDVSVAGNTTLVGGAITSTQKAVEEGRNHFSTAADLTLVDLYNQADYQAEGYDINLGFGFGKTEAPSVANAKTEGSAEQDNKKAEDANPAPHSGTGYGYDSGNAGSVTTAGISAIAGNTEMRTTDEQTGIKPIFDADKVRKEINEQVQVTQAFGQQAYQAVDTYVQEERKTLREQMQQATTKEEKAAIQTQLDDLLLQERVMNVLIGAVTGMGASALTKEVLSAAANEMRQIMIKDSKKFLGAIDTEGKTLDNMSKESEGVRGDGFGLGGTRVDLDLLCGADNSRCAVQMNVDGTPLLDMNGKTQLELKDGKVQFLGSFDKFLTTPEGQKMVGATGGIQGFKGELFGVPYEAGSWQDKLIESFAGTHDYIGGSLSGLYDEQGNATRGRTEEEKRLHDRWSEFAILPSTPFAVAELLPAEIWTAISILIKGAK